MVKKEGLYEIDTDIGETRLLLQNNPEFNSKLDDMNHNDEPLTHSVSVNQYGATENLPPLTIVVVDTLPQDLQKTGLVWEWFGYVLLANLILVILYFGSPLIGACAPLNRSFHKLVA